jgi:hypothetical protein
MTPLRGLVVEAITLSNKAKEELCFWPDLAFISNKGQKHKPLPIAMLLRLVDLSGCLIMPPRSIRKYFLGPGCDKYQGVGCASVRLQM